MRRNSQLTTVVLLTLLCLLPTAGLSAHGGSSRDARFRSPMAVDKKTVVTRDGKKVAVTTLKSGESVVVDALGDDASDLVAKQIRVVPPLTPPAKKNPGGH